MSSYMFADVHTYTYIVIYVVIYDYDIDYMSLELPKQMYSMFFST